MTRRGIASQDGYIKLHWERATDNRESIKLTSARMRNECYPVSVCLYACLSTTIFALQATTRLTSDN